MGGGYLPEKKKDESPLAKITKDCARPACEQVHGLMSQVMKDMLFNLKPKSAPGN
jgi:COP9 signalosome complex subunit 5